MTVYQADCCTLRHSTEISHDKLKFIIQFINHKQLCQTGAEITELNWIKGLEQLHVEKRDILMSRGAVTSPRGAQGNYSHHSLIILAPSQALTSTRLCRLGQSCWMITLLRTTLTPGACPSSSSSRMGGPLLGRHSHPKSSATPRRPSRINSASSPSALATMWTTSCWRGWPWRTVAWQGFSRRMRMQPATSRGLFWFFCPLASFGMENPLVRCGKKLEFPWGSALGMIRYSEWLPRNFLFLSRPPEMYWSFPAPQSKAFVSLIHIIHII